jgi:hypothetical protein
MRFERGVVSGIEPTISGVLMSGEKGRIPSLRLRADERNSDGESFACIEVQPTADGELNSETPVEIVHRKEPRLPDGGSLARHAIARIIWSGNTPRFVDPLVFFNLRYRKFAAGNRVFHFFL